MFFKSPPLVCAWAVLWFYVIPFAAKYLLAPWIRKQSWKEQWVSLQTNTFKTTFDVSLPKDKDTAFAMLVESIPMLCQHGLGGLLCVPALLLGPSPITTAMACHGGLSEAGWELMDLAKRAHEIKFGGQEGKDRNPTSLVIVMVVHHAMGLSMVIPMNIYYRQYSYYHEIIFLLQFAAFFALMFQHYGHTLDTKTEKGLCAMKYISAVTLLVMLYSRCFRYLYIAGVFCFQLYTDGHTALLVQGSVALSLMALINIAFCVDTVKRFCKYACMKHVDESCKAKAAKHTCMKHTAKQEMEELSCSLRHRRG
jgi:hypothetical protein